MSLYDCMWLYQISIELLFKNNIDENDLKSIAYVEYYGYESCALYLNMCTHQNSHMGYCKSGNIDLNTFTRY